MNTSPQTIEAEPFAEASRLSSCQGYVNTQPHTHSCHRISFAEFLRKPLSRHTIRRAAPGQSLVEFAIALPFLLILLMVLIEVGFLLRSYTTVVSAVRESTRAASAAGNADPYDNAWNPTLQDGDTIVVSTVNLVAIDELKNIKLVMSYRADSTAGRSGTGSNDGTGISTGGTGSNSRYWPVATMTANSTTIPYQRVFARTGASGPFTTTVLTGSACSNATTPLGISAFCGKNWNTAAYAAAHPGDANNPPRVTDTTNSAKVQQDPWYPSLRFCKDITQGITTDTSQATNPYAQYYNNPAITPNWLGVRVEFNHPWTTGFFPIPTIPLSDSAVKIFEPNPAACT